MCPDRTTCMERKLAPSSIAAWNAARVSSGRMHVEPLWRHHKHRLQAPQQCSVCRQTLPADANTYYPKLHLQLSSRTQVGSAQYQAVNCSKCIHTCRVSQDSGLTPYQAGCRMFRSACTTGTHPSAIMTGAAVPAAAEKLHASERAARLRQHATGLGIPIRRLICLTTCGLPHHPTAALCP